MWSRRDVSDDGQRNQSDIAVLREVIDLHVTLTVSSDSGSSVWALFVSGDDSVVRAPVRIPAEAAGEVSSPVSTFCADSYFGVRSTPVLPQ